MTSGAVKSFGVYTALQRMLVVLKQSTMCLQAVRTLCVPGLTRLQLVRCCCTAYRKGCVI